ncbi:hypothetical protein [Phaeobacter sp. 22II1-1F12B]|uniref:hypothetical protein n=1 Tax=Phaeobacter sp. 22II1-1F12B TaxID=1317111 RepID=UPI000B527798|nr:hypothetical protein [Phaeobacter sp. 22II1-1F12B]OWU81811.1 hypothetical protein ATO1_02500 [Phaeobacter sp. 22II1-1F12B]
MDTAADNSAALAIRDSACDDLIAKLEEEAAASDADTSDIAPFVKELFARYFDASQKKNEPAEVASAKISKMVGKQARKKFAISSEPAPTPEPEHEAETAFAGQVAGKTSGIDRKILNILTEVSAHFGEPITILSGQRSKPQQAQALYTNWQSHLRRGKDNAYLAKNEKLREQLDALKQEKNKDKFVALLNKSADFSALSRHIDGNEVDLAANTDPDLVAALATCLNHSAGRNSEGARCHHFDNRKAVWPITESTRAKWKTP